jgi:hypothetical protein
MQQCTDMFRTLSVWFCFAFLLVMADPTPNFLGFVSPHTTDAGAEGDEYTVSIVAKPGRTESVVERVRATQPLGKSCPEPLRRPSSLLALVASPERVKTPSRASPHPLRC